MNRERVVIFGAGGGGVRAVRGLRRRVEIVALLDSDPRRHGTLLGCPVVAPESVRRLHFDRVLIASASHFGEMHELLSSLGVEDGRIVAVPGEVLHDERLDGMPRFCILYWSILTATLVALLWVVTGIWLP